MKVDVVDTKNQKVGDIELDDSVFGAAVREHLHWEVVRMQQANRRRGTHSTKTVSEVRGSGTKPYKQKGTGRARHGSTRAMNMRGGGIVHGPRPRDYSYQMPRKMVKVALRSALSLRFGQSCLHVVRGWTLEAPKTKEASAVLAAFGSKALVVGSKDDLQVNRSVRNLPNAKYLNVEDINVYDILRYDKVILLENVLENLSGELHTELSRKERALREEARA
ncbi:MAG: 50S ribosomal protein L4 [Myxococcales bacterium]|nr:50S ribosomal protein L4 [Myxococcales bacterium]